MTDAQHSLTEAERLHLAAILAEIPGEPTRHQIDVSATLARSMAAWSTESQALRDEGTVIETPTGITKMNPRVAVVSDLFKAILSARRSLQIHARAIHGEAQRVARRREILKQYEAGEVLASDLLAKPGENT